MRMAYAAYVGVDNNSAEIFQSLRPQRCFGSAMVATDCKGHCFIVIRPNPGL